MSRGLRCRALAVTLSGALTSVGAPVRAEWGEPLGPDFQVNSSTPGNQREPDTAAAPDGQFVVVWSGAGAGVLSGVFQQRFDATGTPIAGELVVSENTSSGGAQAQVAFSPSGNHLVVWTNLSHLGTDFGQSIRGRVLAADGTRLSAEFQINSYTTGAQLEPSVVALTDGSFVVAWQSNGSPGNDPPPGSSLLARHLASNGAPLDPEFQVNTYTTGAQEFASVAARPDGSFVVGWRDLHAVPAPDYDVYLLAARAMAPTPTGMTPLGPETVLGGGSEDDMVFDDVILQSLPDGTVMAVWTHPNSLGSGLQVDGLRWDPDSTEPPGPFVVGPGTLGVGFPDLSEPLNGTFVATWTGGLPYPYESLDGSGSGILASGFDSLGAILGEEMTVNSYTTGNQRDSAVTALPDGKFVLVWESVGSGGDDQSGSSIQARILSLLPPVPLFADDFESGEFDEWDDAVFDGAPPEGT